MKNRSRDAAAKPFRRDARHNECCGRVIPTNWGWDYDRSATKLMSILLFERSAVFLILAAVLARTAGAINLSILDYYCVVCLGHLLVIAAILFTAGSIVRLLVLLHP